MVKITVSLLQLFHITQPRYLDRTGSDRPVIPKRGEKDFEPSTAGGSSLQVHYLDRARSAMLDVLRATPHTSRYGSIDSSFNMNSLVPTTASR